MHSLLTIEAINSYIYISIYGYKITPITTNTKTRALLEYQYKRHEGLTHVPFFRAHIYRFLGGVLFKFKIPHIVNPGEASHLFYSPSLLSRKPNTNIQEGRKKIKIKKVIRLVGCVIDIFVLIRALVVDREETTRDFFSDQPPRLHTYLVDAVYAARAAWI